jgi:putative nucleotidyltransferase with HDIG domain
MSAPSLDELLDHADALPSLPEIVHHVLDALKDDNADIDTLVHHINTDPAIVSRLLAGANASAFGLAAPVDSARQAFMVLGENRVVSIILATALIERYSGQNAGFDPRGLWRHTLGVATCARALAERLSFSPEMAFTGGLLHDIGKLLMLTAAPAAYAGVMHLHQTEDMPIVAAELSVFGYDHATAGGQLATIWNLPYEICEAISAHHDPDSYSSEFGELIHVANVLSHALELGDPPGNRVPDLSERACVSLGLSWPAFAGRFGEIEARYQGIRLVLGI